MTETEELTSAIQQLTETIRDRGISTGAPPGAGPGGPEPDVPDESGLKGIKQKFNLVNEIGSLAEKALSPIASLAQTILKFQTDVGTSLGNSAVIVAEAAAESFKSFTEDLIPVSIQDILDVERQFQKEFGGLIDTEDAANLAEQGKLMGLSARQLAEARRNFMTTAYGDVEAARGSFEKFMALFKSQNLTYDAAIRSIERYSELIARNGDRFAESFTRAAAEATKIGVDLNKIDQIGDNIISNFEGFLEGQSELAAMGLAFDSSRLAEIAATGDTDALMQELQVQLRDIGITRIENLSRPQRLALEQMGLPISQVKRLIQEPTVEVSGSGERAASLADTAAKTAAEATISGTLKTTEAVEKTNSILGYISRIVTGILGVIATNKLLGNPLGGLGAGMAGRALPAIGAVLGAKEAYEAGQEGNTTAGVVSALGTAASSAMLGFSMGGPYGAAIGGLVGLGIGAVSQMLGASQKETPAEQNIPIGETETIEVPIPPGDDVISNAGYGTRSLITPSATIPIPTTETLVSYADDMITSPGYGERTLVTPSNVIALNNQDTIVSYADDMVSNDNSVKMLSKGEIINNNTTQPVVNFDTTKLENKLERMIQAFSAMNIQLDGMKVGKVVYNVGDVADAVGVFGIESRQTF